MDAETFAQRMRDIFASIDQSLGQIEWLDQRNRRHEQDGDEWLAPVIPLRRITNTDD